MRPVETVRAALEARGLNTKGPDHHFEAQCPAHEDRNPSFGVKEGQDNCALIFCQAGCSTEEVLGALGLEMRDLFEDRPDRAPQPKVVDEWTPEAEYVYTDAEGNKLLKVIRFPEKRFRQQRWTPGGWEWGLDGVERQLFRLPEVLAAKAKGDYVFLCEGEKDAIAVTNAGKCGTTMPGGAGKWEAQYTDTLTGANVVVLADDDAAGHKHAELVYQALYGKAAKLGVRLAAAGHKDIADHLAAGLSLNGDLRKMPGLAVAPDTVSARPSTFTAQVFAGRPTSEHRVLGPLFQRGMRTVIGAGTGEGKTTFVMQAIAALTEGHEFLDWRPSSTAARALIVDLEQGEYTLQTRLREAGLDSSERVDILWEPNGIALDQREEDRAMVRDILREGGYDLVLFDPLYQSHLGSGNDEAVAAATMRVVDGWAREFNCALVVPMHARKPAADAPRKFTKHDIAGVGTWLRNAEFVMGLQMRNPGFSQLYFFKDRIGRGPEINSWWGLSFDRDHGFNRNLAEDKRRVTEEVNALLGRDEGCTRDDLEKVRGLDELGLERVLRRKTVHEQGGQYRDRPWVEQTAMDIPTATDVNTS